MEITDNPAEPKNNPKYNKLSFAKTKTFSVVVHKLKTKFKPPATAAESNRYIV